MNCNIILLYILCKLQLQQTHNTMASKPSLNTSTFIEGEQNTKPPTSHGNSDVATTSAHSYVVPQICDRCSNINSNHTGVQEDVSNRSNQSLSGSSQEG